jgi:hypothetical protein
MITVINVKENVLCNFVFALLDEKYTRAIIIKTRKQTISGLTR